MAYNASVRRNENLDHLSLRFEFAFLLNLVSSLTAIIIQILHYTYLNMYISQSY